MIIIFFQYRHIGDRADRYRCRQTDSRIADTDAGIGIVEKPDWRAFCNAIRHQSLDAAGKRSSIDGNRTPVLVLCRAPVTVRQTPSFQVEGPQNREISPFVENKIGRFFTGTFQGGKTVRNSGYHVTISVNRTSVMSIDTV